MSRSTARTRTKPRPAQDFAHAQQCRRCALRTRPGIHLPAADAGRGGRRPWCRSRAAVPGPGLHRRRPAGPYPAHLLPPGREHDPACPPGPAGAGTGAVGRTPERARHPWPAGPCAVAVPDPARRVRHRRALPAQLGRYRHLQRLPAGRHLLRRGRMPPAQQRGAGVRHRGVLRQPAGVWACPGQPGVRTAGHRTHPCRSALRGRIPAPAGAPGTLRLPAQPHGDRACPTTTCRRCARRWPCWSRKAPRCTGNSTWSRRWNGPSPAT
ncbi:hypothetical protein LT20_03268 [Pseudomonas aeruginosa]|nr:hypothetical protein LT20_03268 [Pseudomonas aeruginosa]